MVGLTTPLKTPALRNWMKNVETQPAVVVEATTVEEVQDIVRNKSAYPSPVRAAGTMASPTAVHLNNGGTIIQLKNFDKIHGLKEIALSEGKTVTCIDTDCGVTLRELQKYAHKHDFEVPFSAEIGFATIGGTAMTTTKDSTIGKSPVPGMGIGDVGSCVFAMSIVRDNGELKEYRVMDEETGKFDPFFQGLLDSCGTQGIGVRFLVVVRPKTSITTTIHLLPPPKKGETKAIANKVLDLHARAAALDGNLFAIFPPVGSKNVTWVEERIPSANKWQFAPIGFILAPFIVRLKKFLIQRCLVPTWTFIFHLVSGSFLLRFKQSSRAPGNRYQLDVAENKRKLTFTYFSFPYEEFSTIVSEGLVFTEAYREETGFVPDGFGTYFVDPNGKRLAGPYQGGKGLRFSFDPLCHNPNDPEWEKFCVAFNKFAKSRGGRAAVNQTLGLEKDAAFGGQALWGNPSPRFTTEWLQRMFDAREVS